ncbi:MAG: hypothetical protein ABL998_06385 [Planctomycetota bacterium]
MPTSLTRGLLFATLAGLVTPSSAQTGTYTLTDVGPGRQSFGEAGLSDTGFVVSTFTEAGRLVGFRWSGGTNGAASSFSLFDPPPGITWHSHTAVGVNDAGTVIGHFGTDGITLRRGYQWKAGTTTELFTPQGFSAFPRAINSAGAIVGYGAHTGGVPGAVIWSPTLVPSYVADLEEATDLDDQGRVVGYRLEGTGRVARGYLWDGTGLVALGSLDPTNRGGVYPNALDEQGRVVGTSYVGSVAHAFLWTATTGMRVLAGFPNRNPVLNAVALDINDAGWIVGYTPDASGIRYVLWGPDGSLHDLEEQIADRGPGTRWTGLTWALRITTAGQVAGGALTGTDVRPVLLTPANLAASALVPGLVGVSNSLTVDHARPGQAVFLLGDLDDGLDQGYTRIPGCGSLGLALARPRFVSSARADGAGRSTHGWLVPPALAGLRVRLQALQLGGCALSNVVRVTF